MLSLGLKNCTCERENYTSIPITKDAVVETINKVFVI